MSLRFYARDAGVATPSVPTVDLVGLIIEVWRPSLLRLRPKGAPPVPFAAWWLFHHLGIFANRECGAVCIRDGERLAHVSLVTPRWPRFPDMAADDLQIGGVWTDPDYRGRGLATAAIGAALLAWHGRYGRMWYITADDNRASIHVIEKFDFRLAGRGIRTRPLGVGVLGQFRLQPDIHA